MTHWPYLYHLDQKLIVKGTTASQGQRIHRSRTNGKDQTGQQEAFTYLPIDAKVISISPDAVQTDRMSYYEIELELDSQTFENGDMQYKLVPGIQVHVFILTGERTILSYITTPFHNGVSQALQER